MMYNTLIQMMMMLSWKLQRSKMITMPCKGGGIIVHCGLNSLSTGRVFWLTPSPIPIMKTSRNNSKPFMGYSSTLTPSNGFENKHLQKNKGLLPYVFLRAVILHVQTLEPSSNLYFWRQELIWTHDKLIGFQSVTRRRSSCITTGSLWININKISDESSN